MQEKTEITSFKQRWADLLCDEQAEEDDLIAFVGLDSYDPAPKPYRAFSRKEVAGVLHKN